MKTNAAYELYRFEQTSPKVEVVKTPAKKARISNRLKVIVTIYLCLIIALMGITVYNQSVVTELQSQINSAASTLKTLKTEYQQLSVKLENMVSLSAAEAYVVGELGLVKIDDSQIIYLDMSSENVFIEGEQSQNIISALKTALGSVADYFGW